MINYVKCHSKKNGSTLMIYTDSVGEAAGFCQYENGDWVELSVADEDFIATEPRPWSGRIFFECDEAKDDCSRNGCNLPPDMDSVRCRKTRDVRHARNFYVSSGGDFFEKL